MDDKPTLVCVDPARVDEIWPHVSSLMDEAYRRFGSQDERQAIEQEIRNGTSLLWIVWSASRQIEAISVTDLVKEDGKIVCRLRAVAGRQMSRWLKLIAEIEKYARTEKCKSVRYVGRLGWKAVLGPDYRVTHVQAEKVL